MAAKVPEIVYSNSWAQTGQITNVVLFTPLVAGLFRISAYEVNPSGFAISGGPTISYADDNGAQTVSTGLGADDVGNSVVVEATPAAAFEISSYGSPSVPWGLYLTIEAL